MPDHRYFPTAHIKAAAERRRVQQAKRLSAINLEQVSSEMDGVFLGELVERIGQVSVFRRLNGVDDKLDMTTQCCVCGSDGQIEHGSEKGGFLFQVNDLALEGTDSSDQFVFVHWACLKSLVVQHIMRRGLR